MSKRAYHSRLRDARAAETRRRVRRSARRLFGLRGFGGTTVKAIAEEAGVAPQTVYAAFGSKGAIVREMVEELEESIDLQRWVARIVAEPAPRAQLALFVAMLREMFETGTPLLRAMLEGRGDADVAGAGAEGDARRREGAGRLAAGWEAAGVLRPGLTAEAAADRVVLLTSVETFLFAHDRLGWDADAWQGWLEELLARELLA